MYCFDRPKSIMYTLLGHFSLPMMKLSGLRSLCMKLLVCRNLTLSSICSASIRMVFNENLRLFSLNNVSRLLPSSSITIRLYPKSVPQKYIFGIPMSCLLFICKWLYSFASKYIWGCLLSAFSTFIANWFLLIKWINLRQYLCVDRCICLQKNPARAFFAFYSIWKISILVT